MKRKRKPSTTKPAAPSVEPGVLVPTPEREQQSAIERLMSRDGKTAATTMDDTGNRVRPYRAINTILDMERRGRISAVAADAGYRFRDDFDAGQLNELRASDWSSPFVDGKTRPELGIAASRARDRVYEALGAVGGITGWQGSCLFHVVGMDVSLREWSGRLPVPFADRQAYSEKHNRWISEEGASVVLRTALDSLRAHYEREDGPRKGIRSQHFQGVEKNA